MLSVLKNSIDAQVCTDFEWIIVDDGSTDDTRKLATAWMKQKLPYRLKYIWQENQGKQSAFNTAVKEAIGEWLICVDSDDHLTKLLILILFIIMIIHGKVRKIKSKRKLCKLARI